MDPHPADDMIENLGKAFMGVFNGDNMRQTIRDAWDKIHMPSGSEAQKQTDANNVKAVQDANQGFVDASTAAKIRTGVAKRMK